MKKACALILFLVFLLHTFHAEYLTVWFYRNQSRVAAEFCINKSRPALKCNGKCFLSKKLKAAEEQQENGSTPTTKQSEETVPFILFPDESLTCACTIINNVYPSLVTDYEFIHCSKHFHPPAASA